MSMGTKLFIGFGAAAVLFGIIFVVAIFGVKNTCVVHENGIGAQYEANQIALAGYTNKIMDMVQVPKMAKDHIKEVALAAIQGRYGANGSQAVFHAVQEQNPTVDSGLYRSLMQAMEAGRNGFDADQKTMQDKCRTYRNYYQSAPQSFLVGFLGYPKASLDTVECKPVITEQTREDFRTKNTGPLQIN